jgi:hypothetical protein
MNELRLPLDFEQSSIFRRLVELFNEGEAGARRRAVYVWTMLYRDLAYLAQEGNQPGWIHAKDVPMLARSMGEGEGFIEHLVEPVKLLIKQDEGFICPRFAMLNSSGMAGGRTREQRGGDMRAYNQNQKRAGESLMQQALEIPGENFKDGEGQPLSSDEVKRVMWLIRACDNALFKPERPNFGFRGELVANAAEIVRRMLDEEIDAVCRKVARNRAHPALIGMTTEKLLPGFGQMAGQLE